MMSHESVEPGTQIIKEGKAETFAPSHVFYNPVQEFNRDLTIAVISEHVQDHFRNLREKQAKANQNKQENVDEELQELPVQSGTKYESGVQILEALSASGLRSVRFALEIPGVKNIVANDFDENAVGFIRRNVSHNNVEDIVTASCADASMVMYQNRKVSDRFDVIDLDPYGTAAPFLDASVQAVKDGGLLCVTCTDMAVLAGNSPETCHAKYQSMSLKAKFCHEQALRILLQCIDSHANRYSRYIVPLLSISADFYIRVFVRIFTGQSQVKHSVSKLSMVYHCVGCGHSTLQPIANKTPTNDKGDYKFTAATAPVVKENCSICGSRHHIGGPIWTARLHDVDFVRRVIERIQTNKTSFGTADRIHGVLSVVTEELHDVPLYYINDEITRILHCQPMKMMDLRSAILNAGYDVSFSHGHKNSVKTTAPMEVLWDIYRCWVRTNPVKESRLQDGSPAKAILSTPPTLEADFTEHPDANPPSRKKGLLRWQHNPEKDWGPKARASKGEGGDLGVRRQKGIQKSRQKRKALNQTVVDWKAFPCKRHKKGKCNLGDKCKYSHDIQASGGADLNSASAEDSDSSENGEEPMDSKSDDEVSVSISAVQTDDPNAS